MTNDIWNKSDLYPAQAGTAQGQLSIDACGEWLVTNALNNATPFTDFCKVNGNVCNNAGQSSYTPPPFW